MGIPYGTQYTATVGGSTFQEVECENCSTVFVYQVERQVSASDTSVLWLDNRGAQARASQQAHDNLLEALAHAVDPVHCPTCGWLQKNMCSILKRRRLYIALGIFLPLALVLLVWGLAVRVQPGSQTTLLLTLSAVCAVVGPAGGIGWYVLHNPNGAHPGDGGTNHETAAGSKGVVKEEMERAHEQARQEWQEMFHNSLRRTMLQMSAADGAVDESELTHVGSIYQQVTGDELPLEVARAEAAQCESQKAELVTTLTRLGGEITDEGKALFIRANIVVAAADGDVGQTEWQWLVEIGQALQMTRQQFERVLAEMKDG